VYLRLWLILAALPAAFAQAPKNPFAQDPNAPENGRTVFRIYCEPCHGIHGQGGRGPDLTRGNYSNGTRDEDLYRIVANGIPGTAMNGFGGELGDDNVWRVVSYLRTIATRNTEPMKGNAAAGEKLFRGKGGCANCHIVNGRGGRLGPELSKIGPQHTVAYLREAILEPNKDISSGYSTVTIVKRDGTKITGIERGLDNFSVQLMDSSDNYYSFLKRDLSSIQEESRSLMPNSYGRLFTPAELDDLLAYLVSLGARETKP